MSKLLTKITFKAVAGIVETFPVTFTDDEGNKKTAIRAKEQLLMRVAGVVKKTEAIQTAYGESIRFLGNFRAIALLSGEVFDSGKLFLPAVAETYVLAAFESAKDDEGFQGLEMAFDLGVIPAANNQGYQYNVTPLLEKKQEDELDRMLSHLPTPLLLAAE